MRQLCDVSFVSMIIITLGPKTIPDLGWLFRVSGLSMSISLSRGGLKIMVNLKPLSIRPHVNYGRWWQEGSYKLQQEWQKDTFEMQLAAWVTLTKAMLNTASPSNQDVFIAIENGDKGEPWQKQAGTQLIKMHSKVLEIISMQDNSDCNFEKALTKASMAHPTKIHAAILTIIMHKTTFKMLTFKKNPQLITSSFGWWFWYTLTQ